MALLFLETPALSDSWGFYFSIQPANPPTRQPANPPTRNIEVATGEVAKM